MIITPTEDDIFTALRAFLQDVLPAQSEADGFVVVVGQENRVPEPSESNFIVIWPLRMPRLSTTVEKLIGIGLQATYEQSSECVLQVNVHGPESFNNASIVSTLFRSGYAVDFFAARGTTISPLHADDPRNVQFTDGEQQYEDRYAVEAHLQINQTITTDAQSARELELGIASVETTPASWPNSTVTVTP